MALDKLLLFIMDGLFLYKREKFGLFVKSYGCFWGVFEMHLRLLNVKI